jgi:tetratricopeptide (TPR) repeat protein
MDSSGAPRDINRLGLLYARFGLFDDAVEQFLRVSEVGYVPSTVNLGNVYFLSGEYRKASEAYNRALEQSPNNARAIVGLAKAQFELENLGEARQLYGSIADTHPELAERYAYLAGDVSGTARARSVDLREVVEWDE